jgi:hypothetical protein
MQTKSQEGASRLLKVGCLSLIGMAILIYVGIQVYNLAFNSPSRVLVQAALRACKGDGDNQAASYSLDANGLHLMIVVNPSRPWWWGQPLANRYGSGRLPASLEELQLVACIGEKRTEEVSKCVYTAGGSLKRHQQHQDIRIVSAQTGEMISEFTISSVVPSCPDVYTRGNEPDLSNPVTLDDIFERLKLQGNLPEPSGGAAASAPSAGTTFWGWVGFGFGLFTAGSLSALPANFADKRIQEQYEKKLSLGCLLILIPIAAGFVVRIALHWNPWLVLGLTTAFSLLLGFAARLGIAASLKSGTLDKK